MCRADCWVVICARNKPGHLIPNGMHMLAFISSGGPALPIDKPRQGMPSLNQCLALHFLTGNCVQRRLLSCAGNKSGYTDSHCRHLLACNCSGGLAIPIYYQRCKIVIVCRLWLCADQTAELWFLLDTWFSWHASASLQLQWRSSPRARQTQT